MSMPIAPKRSKKTAKPAAAPAFAGDCAAPNEPLRPGYKWNRLLGIWMPDPKHPDHVQIFRDTFPAERRKGEHAPSRRHVPPNVPPDGGEERIPEYMRLEEREEMEDAEMEVVGLDSSSMLGRDHTPEGGSGGGVGDEEMVEISDGTSSEDEEVARLLRFSNSSSGQDEKALEFGRLRAESLARLTDAATRRDEEELVPLSRVQRAIARKRAHRPSWREREGSIEWSLRSSSD